ncbi:Hsp20/alpha crystallin family protein [Thermochromatium tepidum]|uniref:Hsp20 family protein n=1 Tax=Thermochromatium tepidum ATCC 43061 TaxID=316276 RepID=A0A6I6E4Q8_THETI|nr:Hsp20/alpha crystallin family protein [Thermochromatium tepidum]QGU31643.1 Hsp20 family protein [Thermochromatium tepidum ATCC 43061]
MKLGQLKQDVFGFLGQVAEGWRHLVQSASGALTRFRPSEHTQLPDKTEVDDASWLPSRGWAMLGGDLFEDEHKLVVRLEIPGLDKTDLNVEIGADTLVVSGEKRFEQEGTKGRWRVMQCAYGSFRRVVPLPLSVKPDEARATYKNGVLRVELPKAEPSQPKSVRIEVR